MSEPVGRPAASPASPPEKVPACGYLALLLALLFFSGWCAGPAWLRFLDFGSLLGVFGNMAGQLAPGLNHASGVRQGFLFALSLLPGIMLALGAVELAAHFGALRAAQKLLSPLLCPLLGLPGAVGLALIGSLQSSDAGGAMTRELFEQGRLNERERLVFAAFQFSAGGAVANYLSTASVLFVLLPCSALAPLGVILVFKVAGANLMRLYLRWVEGPAGGR